MARTSWIVVAVQVSSALVVADLGAYFHPVLAERSLPDDLAGRLRTLADVWAQDSDLAALFLFGSRARGDGGPRSDVDLAVILAEQVEPARRLRKRLELSADAALRLGTDAVDVIVLEEAPATLGHRVLADGRLRVERLPARRVEVAETTLRRYLDQAPLRDALDRGLAGRVREGRFAR